MVFYIAQCYTFAVHNATLLYYTKHGESTCHRDRGRGKDFSCKIVFIDLLLENVRNPYYLIKNSLFKIHPITSLIYCSPVTVYHI